jgi:NAD(P)-dependent dehydrogenase (short-subunit alcohol dehydrogenase family)
MSKTIVITGGSRGIGAATARLAGARGWSVGFSYLSNDKAAAETVAAVAAAGGKAIAIKGDVAKEDDVVRLFDETVAAFGPISGVVNNAGVVLGPPGPLADTSTERLMMVIAINILGAMLVAREGVRRMATNRGGAGGAIVNVSSAAARLGGANEYVDYAASKGALDTLTIGLAKECGGLGVRVNAVRPGVIDTELHASGGQPDRAEMLGGSTPLGRAGRAEEVAEAIMWLLSDTSSYVTGALFDVTGGR